MAGDTLHSLQLPLLTTSLDILMQLNEHDTAHNPDNMNYVNWWLINLKSS
jgi:hypothetical protein